MNPNFNFSIGLAHTPHRVLMTADTIGGVWTYAMELARVFCEQDIEVALATMGAPLSDEQWSEAEQVANLGIFESSYKLEWMRDPWDEVRAAGDWLLELERDLRPDIIHLNNYAHGVLPFHAPKLMVAHSDVFSWWHAVKGEPAPEGWNTYRDVVTTGLRNADLVVAPSRSALTDVLHTYGPLRHTEVVPHGREISFRQLAKEPLILSSGRLWDEAKNICALTSIANALPWPVEVAGDCAGPGGKTVSFENVHLLGRMEGRPWIERLERASIFCLPARYEPFGWSEMEAALAGCALVLGDIQNLREMWRDAAVYVPPDNPDAVRTALQELIDHPDRRRELAQRAHERAMDFTTLRMAASYLALYSELLEPKPVWASLHP